MGEAMSKKGLPSSPAALLGCYSNFTFLAGASHPAEMVEAAAALGWQAVGIADVNSLAGIVRAHVAARDAGIGLVVGATVPQELSIVRDLAPDLPILIPGVGAQGGDLEKSVYEGNKSGIGIINVSRDISFSGDFTVESIRSSAQSYVKKINEALND